MIIHLLDIGFIQHAVEWTFAARPTDPGQNKKTVTQHGAPGSLNHATAVLHEPPNRKKAGERPRPPNDACYNGISRRRLPSQFPAAHDPYCHKAPSDGWCMGSQRSRHWLREQWPL